jgi:hypothetical protein
VELYPSDREAKSLRRIALFGTLLLAVVFGVGCQKHDPLKTLEVQEATVRFFFTPAYCSSFAYDQYKGRIPDPQKHRFAGFVVILKNTGKKTKNFVLAEAIIKPDLRELILSAGWGPPGSLILSTTIPQSIFPGQEIALEEIYFLAEGNPLEIEKLARQSEIRIVWEESGRKWEKVAAVTPAHRYPGESGHPESEQKSVETLKVAEATAEVSFSSDPNFFVFDWYKGKQPNPEKHRNIIFTAIVTNTGERKKRYVFLEPVIEPVLQGAVLNSVSDISRSVIMPGERAMLGAVAYLVEGDPAEIERLAYRTKLRIVWEEDGRKWEKAVTVTPEMVNIQ